MARLLVRLWFKQAQPYNQIQVFYFGEDAMCYVVQSQRQSLSQVLKYGAQQPLKQTPLPVCSACYTQTSSTGAP